MYLRLVATPWGLPSRRGEHRPAGGEGDVRRGVVAGAPDLTPPAGADEHADAPERPAHRAGVVDLDRARVEDVQVGVGLVGAAGLGGDRVQRLAQRGLRDLVREVVLAALAD